MVKKLGMLIFGTIFTVFGVILIIYSLTAMPYERGSYWIFFLGPLFMGFLLILVGLGALLARRKDIIMAQ